MMKFVTKVRPFNSINNFKFQHFGHLNFSSKPKSGKKHNKPGKSHNHKPSKPKIMKIAFKDSVFSDIAEIIGAGSIDLSGGEHRTPRVRRNVKERNEGEHRKPHVRRNVQVRDEGEHRTPSVRRNVQVRDEVEHRKPHVRRNVRERDEGEHRTPRVRRNVQAKDEVEHRKPHVRRNVRERNEGEHRTPSVRRNVQVRDEVEHRKPHVRRNARERNVGEGKGMSVKGDAQVGNLVEKDVSGVVRRVTEIIRGDHRVISMEKQLDKSGCKMSSDIVGKVLKNCFEVPKLATGFFHWVKMKNRSCVTTENYNIMLDMAGGEKDFELIESLMEEMGEYNCEKDVKTWTTIIMHSARVKLVWRTLLTFENMKKSGIELDVEAYRIVIQLLCESEKGEIALEVYKEMAQKGFELDSGFYPQLLDCIADYGDVDVAHLVVNDLINVCNIPEHDAYFSVFKKFCTTRRIKEALELIRDLNKKNVTLSAPFQETLVQGLCSANMIDDALEVVDIMKKRNVVSEVVYGALIDGCLRNKEASKALDLLHRMKDAGFTPLPSTYTELMEQHFNSNEYEKGISLYNEMLETGVKPDIAAYTTMIAGHVRHGHISAAWKVFQSMEEEGITPNENCFLIFIKELLSSTRVNEMVKVLNYMLDSKINIGKEISDCVTSYCERDKDVANLVHVKDVLRRVRDFSEAGVSQDDSSSQGETQKVTDSCEVESNVCPPSQAFTTDEHVHMVCTILFSSDRWLAMQEALEKLQICYTPDLVSKILDTSALYGSALLKFFMWVKRQPGYRHTTETYNLAMKIAGRSNDFKLVKHLFHEMQRNGCSVTPDTWAVMITMYGRVGMTYIALRHFTEMKDSSCKPTSKTYKSLMLAFCGKKGRKVNEAIKLFSEMIQEGVVPDEELVEICFDCFCQAGKLSEARICMEDLQKVGFSKPLSYSLLIRALCRRGKMEEALSLVSEVKEDRSTLDCLIDGSLVNGLLKNGQLKKALSKINSMKEAGIPPTVYVYTSLISHFCKKKDIDRALEIFKMMFGEECYPTVLTYTALLRGFIITGKFQDAHNLFLRMRLKGPFPDFKAYSAVIDGLCEAGRSEDALKLLCGMINDGIVPSFITFQTVFFGLNREGKRHLAKTAMYLKHDVRRKRKFSS